MLKRTPTQFHFHSTSTTLRKSYRNLLSYAFSLPPTLRHRGGNSFPRPTTKFTRYFTLQEEEQQQHQQQMSTVKEFIRAARFGEVEAVRNYLPLASVVHKAKALGHAVREGQFFVTKLLLNEGNTEPQGSCLLEAVRLKHHNIVEELLKYGVIKDYVAQNGRTPLMEAVIAGDEQLVSILLESSVALDTEDTKSRTALTMALTSNRLGIGKQLLKHGASASLCGRFFPLIIRSGDVELIQLLLSAGANANTPYQNGYPLINATRNGSVEMVTTLLESGADVQVSDAKGHTALYYAALSGNVEITRNLVDHGANAKSCGDLIVGAVKDNNIPLVLLLLKAVEKSNSGDVSLRNVFISAVMGGIEELVIALLDAGADVNSVCKKGYSALNYAIAGNFMTIAKRLVEGGAKVVSCEPLMRNAIIYGNIGQVQLLLSCGADPNAVDNNNQQFALITAVKYRQLEILRELLEKGADVNYRPPGGRTALMWAAFNGDIEMVKILLKSNAKVNVQSGDGWTPIMFAARKGFENIVQLFLDAGANLEISNSTKLMALDCIGSNLQNYGSLWRLLKWAMVCNKYEDVDASYFPIAEKYHAEENSERLKTLDTALIRKEVESGDAFVNLFGSGVVKLNERDCFNRTLLMYMAYKGYAGIVGLILSNGASVDYKDTQGMTALTWATNGRSSDVVRILISYNASVNVPDCLHRTALHHALRARDLFISTVLMNANGKLMSRDYLERTLIWAATEGHTFLVHELCKVGVDINEQDEFRATALIWAAFGGHNSCIVELIRSGANINTVDWHGRTALWYALDQGHDEAVDILLPGAGLKDIDNGSPALCVAANLGKEKIVSAMLERGANHEWAEPDGTTVLMCAARAGSAEMVDMLLKKGADVRPANAAGDTALLLASVADAPKVIKLLAEQHDANIEGTNAHGLTPLLIAAEKSNSEAVEALLKCGAKVTAVDTEGRSALDLAVKDRKNISDAAAIVAETLIAWGSEAKDLEDMAEAVLEHFERKNRKREEVEEKKANGITEKMEEKKENGVEGEDVVIDVIDGGGEERKPNGKRRKEEILVIDGDVKKPRLQ